MFKRRKLRCVGLSQPGSSSRSRPAALLPRSGIAHQIATSRRPSTSASTSAGLIQRLPLGPRRSGCVRDAALDARPRIRRRPRAGCPPRRRCARASGSSRAPAASRATRRPRRGIDRPTTRARAARPIASTASTTANRPDDDADQSQAPESTRRRRAPPGWPMVRGSGPPQSGLAHARES